ncbi:MAG TPA: hypothetical protein PK413_12680, partial [Thermoanaerobaculia bacterium]|nr:hypothetical protein [Thermoanaerobaculia bacterium]
MASRQSRRARLAPVAPIRQGLPAPSRFTRLLARAVEWWQAGLEKPGYWLAGFALVGTVALLPSGLVFAPRVEAGAIADRDYLAPEELLVPDEETTRHRQDKAREESQPVYDYDPNPATEAEIAGLFEQGRDIVTGHGESETALSGLISGTHLKLSPEQLRVFLHRNFAPDLEERL